MKFFKLLFLLLALLQISCGGPTGEEPSASSGISVPENVYTVSSNPVNTPLGTWVYSNNLYFEFKADSTWRYYKVENDLSGTPQEVPEYEGTWSVYQLDGKSYLKLVYTKLYYNVITNGWIETETGSGEYYWGITSNTRTAYTYAQPRNQIVEFYADDNYFAMNIYRKNDAQVSLFGEWIHDNYDWYNEYNITYAQESDQTNPGTGSTETVSSSISSIMNLTISGYSPIYVNRTGILQFDSAGKVTYNHTSPFFTAASGSITTGLPDLATPASTSSSAEGTYTLGASNQVNRTTLSWSSSDATLGNLSFEILILRDKNVLMTFPFQKVTP